MGSGSLTVVDTDRALNALLATLREHRELAIDTEFHAENRFVPKLMVVQIATRHGDVWVVDAVKIDASPLARALCEHLLVLHGGRTDIQLLHHVGGDWPKEVVDTQRVAALVGYGFPASLQTLTRALLQIELDKAATLTDWHKRPLTPTQVEYAAKDALVLFPLLDALKSLTDERGRSDWIAEVSREVIEEAAEPDPTPWTSWGVTATLGTRELQVLDRLVRWRATQARAKDRPLHYVLSDAVAVDLAKRRPATVDELSSNRRIPQGLIHRHADELLEEIREAALSPQDLPEVPTAGHLRIQRLLHVWAETHERSTQVASGLTIPVALARRIAVHGLAAVTGWRRIFMGVALGDFLDGTTSLHIEASDVSIINAAKP